MRTLFLLALVFSAFGCGTPTPFQRGPKSDHSENVAEAGTPGEPQAATELNENYFAQKIFPLLERDCAVCHDNPAPTFVAAKALVVFKKPKESPLVVRPSGEQHETVWAKGTAEYEEVVAWVMGAQ